MNDHEAFARGVRIRHAQKSARSTLETRIALIVAERGLTEKQLAKYARKNCKPRFDHWRFAEDQGISTNWLFDGAIRAFSRQLAPHKVRLPARVARAARRGADAPTQKRWRVGASSSLRCASGSRTLPRHAIYPMKTSKR
jgi:hypothetical protein